MSISSSKPKPLFVNVFGLLTDPGRSMPFQARIDSMGLTLVDSTQEILIDSAQLSMAQLTLEDRHVCLRATHRSQTLSIYSRDPRFEEGLRPWLSAQAFDNRAVQDVVAMTQWGWFFSGLAALGIALWISYPHLVTLVVDRIPPRWDVEVGAWAWQDVHTPLVHDPAVTKAIDEISAPLLSAIPDIQFPYHIDVVVDRSINAFALPGGHIVLNSGLIASAESPDEVAGVLSHEISHVTRRHGMHALVYRLGTFVLLPFAFGHVTGLLGALLHQAPLLMSLRYSREQESEADQKGLDLLHQAGYPTAGLLRFMERMAEKDKNDPLSLSFLRTHPMSKDRLETLRKIELSYHGSPAALHWTMSWPEIRQRCAKQTKV